MTWLTCRRRENGPTARSFAADAYDCIMVRTRSGPTEYKFVASKRCPNGELPSDPLTDRHRQTPKLCKKPLSQFIIAPRAQASRRCETQASLSGKAAKLWLAFRSLDLFRALREPDRRRRDEKRPCRSEQKTATNQNDYLTGKAPYKSCELRYGRRRPADQVLRRHRRSVQAQRFSTSFTSMPTPRTRSIRPRGSLPILAARSGLTRSTHDRRTAGFGAFGPIARRSMNAEDCPAGVSPGAL